MVGGSPERIRRGPHLRTGRIVAAAVDLVRAYLNVNVYSTMTEYPVLEGVRAEAIGW